MRRRRAPVAFSFPAVRQINPRTTTAESLFIWKYPDRADFKDTDEGDIQSRRLCSQIAPARLRSQNVQRSQGFRVLPRINPLVRSTFAYHRIAIVLPRRRGISAPAIRTFPICSWKKVGNKKNSRCRNENPPGLPQFRLCARLPTVAPCPSALHTSDHSLKPMLSILSHRKLALSRDAVQYRPPHPHLFFRRRRFQPGRFDCQRTGERTAWDRHY